MVDANLLEAARLMWHLLEDIAKVDDHAYNSDDWFRRRARWSVQRRFEVPESVVGLLKNSDDEKDETDD